MHIPEKASLGDVYISKRTGTSFKVIRARGGSIDVVSSTSNEVYTDLSISYFYLRSRYYNCPTSVMENE
jgi:hypothetical protein